MREFEKIRAAIIRGGTSKGVYLLANELPTDPALRDKVILSIFGSPDPRQINGLGGADPLTSKLAIIAPSRREGADVDYTFAYVGIDKAVVDYDGNCGNISQGVGPFAVDEGLVPVTQPITRVRIFNTNTKKIIEAEVPVRGGKAITEGDFVVNGVPGTGAKIVLNFVNSGGSKTGKLLPTGNVVDKMELADGRSVRVSLVDAANPAVFVQAADIGFTGKELPRDTASNPRILAIMEEIRVKAALGMGLAASPEKVSPAVPKVAFVAPPQDYETITGKTIAAAECDLLARTKALAVMHKAYAVTGGICVGAAALIDGTVVNEVVGSRAKTAGVVRVGHPSGVSDFVIAVSRKPTGEFELTQSGVAGTSRRIMDGYVYVPRRIFFPEEDPR
ncbi:MAG TPA: PrpF domain-containing protein [Candidatus Methylomirabilis sp.]|nr:PrpF domain-containing protein [Candidatus Methylomirabilis sp.]HSC71113.1 PrpF domain-containing protein [Candidatus Methylomirabilis sp.]